MGELVARRYPTVLFAKAADHTYVECGTGAKGWACWGGKTGGTMLTSNYGSTERADLIAEPNERARITCYLVNGVCHQAANRVLLPAQMLVLGARGYAVSSAIFGPYGRPAGVFGTCLAPFNQHSEVTTDLPECLATASIGASPESLPKEIPDTASRLSSYLQSVLRVYASAEHLFVADAPDDRALEEFHVELFLLDVDFKLGRSVDRETIGALKDIRRSTERSRLFSERRYFNKEISWTAFVEEFNAMTIAFQYAIAGALSYRQYRQLFDLRQGEVVVLADPEIVRSVVPVAGGPQGNDRAS